LEWEDFLEKEILNKLQRKRRLMNQRKNCKERELERDIFKKVVGIFSKAVDKIVAH
jgi:hypothetical protein